MLDNIKTLEGRPVAIADPDDITLGDLLAVLDIHAERPLVFFYDGRPVKPGYHVTEVKAGQFAALDCGANPEAWTEIFVQLWDVDEDKREHMAAGKFAKIIRKVSEHVGLDGSAKLTFEVSDGVVPMALYRAAAPEVVDGEVHVALSARPSSCKPRDRWLKEQQAVQAQTNRCCGPSSAKPCCG
ncbi:hypothetical protein Rumeso_04610 [Rubellimicrobium mesophilum DSM 19309]|uniref:Uncharacterized protein n=1 Tax=Rubellimicrobium mesophilum DSM 19309 TaxID=442562 RepID=A0A017HH47_9RHOB|nr:DUF6428 family protein [Rubellimicrobium mesophilum]EYD73837.1 hypothetical protein Rumeso_04610 [Rubellimicrobium mesophilum DSM 19309]